MSSDFPQELNSDFFVYNTDETSLAPINPLPETAFQHDSMLLDSKDEEFFNAEHHMFDCESDVREEFAGLVKLKGITERSQIEREPQIDDHLKTPTGSTEPEKDAVDELLADLKRAHTPTRVPSQASSDASSLEPLSEAFDVPTPVSPSLSDKELPIQRDSRRHSQNLSKRTVEGEAGPHRLRPLDFSMVSSFPTFRAHKRAKSETPSTLNSPTEERKHWEANDDPLSISSPVKFSHFHLEGACEVPRLPVSVPPSPNWAPLKFSSPLIADVNVAKSRVLITKTHCFYPEKSNLIPFSSCLLGFQLVFHSADPKARIKHSQIKLTLISSDGNPSGDVPIIKAIYPSQGMIHKAGDTTLVRRTDENSIGVKLGVDPYGAMVLSHTQSRTQESYTSPYLLGSGIETNKLLITMNEDSSLHSGVPPSLAFAILLYLPSELDKAFQADLTIETSVRNEISASLRKMWASPKVWRLNYDGKTELGCLKIHK